MVEITEDFKFETHLQEEHHSFTVEWKVHREVIDQLFQEESGFRTSPIFMSKFYNSKWNIIVQRSVNSSKDLTLDLLLRDAGTKHQEFWIKQKFIVRNGDPSKDDVTEFKEWYNPASCGKSDKYHKALIDSKIVKDGGFWHNNFFVIACEVDIKIIEKEPPLSNLSGKQTKPNQINLADSYAALLASGKYSDITLSVGNKKFKAHKNILTTNCEYFNAMFGDGFKESADKMVEIKDVDPEIFKVVLKFIYTFQLPDNFGFIVKDLLQAADRFCLKPLVEKCKEKLCENVKVDNCVELLILVDTFNQAQMKKELISFIKFYLKKVVKTKQWLELKKNYPELAFEAMEGSLG